ncbi:MAG: hypothetical protein KC493_17785 [Bacteriovoracaceae bacterium]|nr:hypothetical protein [Bacteriovoracaceae bacterium]
MNIIIVTTPNSNLKETGFGSLQSCGHVMASITEAGHTCSLNLCRTKYDLELVVKRKPDLVVLGVKYMLIEMEENIWLSDFFSSHGINFSGSLKDVLQFDSDKVSAKVQVNKDNIKTSKYFTALPGEYRNESLLPFSFPLFLKPGDAANGNGVDDFSYVSNFKDFESKVLSLHNLYKQPVLVEEYMGGKEFTVAIIEDANCDLIVSAIEIVPPVSANGIRILGAKTKNDNSEVLMKILDISLIKKVKEIAVNAFKSLGVRDFGRFDIKLNDNNDCCFMEANLVPGMTAATSYFPRAFNIDLGMSYDQVIKLIIGQGIRRVPVKLPIPPALSLLT